MKAIRKTIAILAAGVLTLSMLGVFGCSKESTDASASSSAADEAETIEVTAAGGTIEWQVGLDSQGNDELMPNAHYAFTVQNNDSGHVAQNVLFNVTGLDQNGNLLFRTGTAANYIYPGIVSAFAGEVQSASPEGEDTEIAELVVEPVLNEVEWVETKLTDSDIQNLFKIEGTTSSKSGEILTVAAAVTGDPSMRDEVLATTTVSEDALEAHNVTIFYDQDDRIVMGTENSTVLIDDEYLQKVKDFEDTGNSWDDPDANAPFNLAASAWNPPDYKRYEIYVMPGLD